MFRPRDLIFLFVIFSTVLVGIMLPRSGALFQPLPLYCMMAVLFLSFLSIRLADICHTIRHSYPIVGGLLFCKMILLPIGVYFLFRLIWPTFSLAALLLSGISTGVVAPFMANLMGANSSLVVVTVVCSSLLVPFTLPPLVGLFFGQSMEISLLAMMRLLIGVIFAPIFLVEITRKFSPRIVEGLMKWQYSISLVLFGITNLGIFSKYSAFFYQRPETVFLAFLVSLILGAIYFSAGILAAWTRPLEEQMAAIISFGIMNSVLVIVFSSLFFSPLEPTVAAMYTIPFYGMVIPLRAYKSIRLGRRKAPANSSRPKR